MWYLEKTEGTRPPPRDGHTACVIGSRMYIFGGFDAYPIDQFGVGLYAVDLETNEWKRIKTSVSFAVLLALRGNNFCCSFIASRAVLSRFPWRSCCWFKNVRIWGT